MIYLDNNATTRVAPEVFAAMQPYLTETYGNPSSAHSLGRQMKAAVERAREQVAELLGAASAGEIVFTSCGSESDNWAIGGFLSRILLDVTLLLRASSMKQCAIFASIWRKSAAK